MIYGLCADMHCHAWSLFSKPLAGGLNSRLDGMLKEFARLCEHTKDAGGKRVYIAGDVFHVRGNLKTSVLNPTVATFIEMAEEHDLEIRIMPGNHDLEGAEVSWLGASVVSMAQAVGDEAPKVTVVLEPTFFEDDMVAVVPWQNTREGLLKAIAEVSDRIINDGECLSSVDLHLHTGINGVLVGMPDHGWSPEELAAFGFKRVFCGHYHNHKVFEVPTPGGMTATTEIVSIGALTHQTWGDVSTTAGWILVDETEFRQTESNTPKFMDFDESYSPDDYTGNYVRVRGLSMEEDEIRELKQALEDTGAYGVVIHAVAKSKVITRNGKVAGDAVKVEQSITEWIEAAELDDGKSVEAAALDVLNEARLA